MAERHSGAARSAVAATGRGHRDPAAGSDCGPGPGPGPVSRVTDRAGSEISVTVIRPSDRGTQGVHRPKLGGFGPGTVEPPVSYTHLRAHETVLDLVCRLLLEKKTKKNTKHT